MIGFDEAIRLLSGVARPVDTETVPLMRAEGRVLAKPVVAQVNAPRTDVSSMDGYAVASSEALGSMTVIGESFPGAGFQGRLALGQAVRIFTGAPVPAGAVRVVVQENVRREGDQALVDALGERRNIRPVGSDFRKGEALVDAGTLLGPRAITAAAAADLVEVAVYRRPRVRVIATGDELAEPGTARTMAGTIPDSVSPGVAALARVWGAEVANSLRFRDNLKTMQRSARDALDGSDLIVVTGGASVGDRDFAKQMFGEALELIFSKVRIKPGKPAWLGQAAGKLILGLPGNPTSAMVTARLFMAPLLSGMTGRDPLAGLAWIQSPLAEAMEGAGDRETFSRARLERGRVVLLKDQDSGAQRALVAADLLVRRPAGDRHFEPGEMVDTLTF